MQQNGASEGEAPFAPSPPPEAAKTHSSGTPPGDAAPIPEDMASDRQHSLGGGGVSGRYYGAVVSSEVGGLALDLRIDIDARRANSAVMNCISGDFSYAYQLQWMGRTYSWQVYRDSWIVDNPTVEWSSDSVEIRGKVRYWTGSPVDTDLLAIIPWHEGEVGPATVTLVPAVGPDTSFQCYRQATAFRQLTLEVDVCESVNTPPVLPIYDTHAHSIRPPDLPRRMLTIEEAYSEAGIELMVNPRHTIVDDLGLADLHWLPSELHDAMETHFSQFPEPWPKWHLWGLLASGIFEDPIAGPRPSVGGILFDVSPAGGAEQTSERQGFAIFRNHDWFKDLVPDPTKDRQAAAMRRFLYTYIHEIGHAFNLPHSWEKGRSDVLSWMNYDWKYDYYGGSGSFWASFRFSFDDRELIHLRHGDRATVIPGGDPWVCRAYPQAPPGAMARVGTTHAVGQAPMELLVRSKGYFAFMEPVHIELRIRNTSDLPLELDTELQPEYGNLVLYIRRPDGRSVSKGHVQYAPVLYKLATPHFQVLEARQQAVEGADRHSQNILISYGKRGHYFDAPGEYLVRAVFQGTGGVLITSPVHRLRVGHPLSREEERMAQDYFSHEAGLALYLNGSSSPFLQEGMSTLEAMADRFRKSPVGALLSLVLAQNLGEAFHRIENGKVVKYREAEPEAALALTEQALKQQQRDRTTFTNLAYHQLRRCRAELLLAMGEREAARKELRSLLRVLKRRGVNQPVLDDIRAYAKSL